MKASSHRKPKCWSTSISRTSAAVMHTPTTSGIPNSNWSAIAVPITSARSQAMMASSHRTQRVKLTGRE